MASSSASSRSQHSTRVIIIGAGWSGLAAAKTYLQINPNVSLTIIDEDSTVGGVWSSARIYPDLIADSCAAIFDYSDFPMDKELGIDKWADLPAEKVHDYLERYTDKFDLRKRCKLNTKVLGVERDSEKGEEGYVWRLEAETKKDFEEHSVREVLLCDKLIVATGVSSTPSLPDLDWSKFDGPVMHSKEVGKKYKVLTTDPIKRVTVVGGNKSAVDVVYLCALAGIEVDWVIREEGYGPGVLFEARTKGKHAGAIKAARASAIPFPNILATSGFWYWFLHSGQSQVGTFLLKWSLEKFSKKAIKSMYGKNEHTMKAAPDVENLFWSRSGESVVHENGIFMDLLAVDELIHIHRASITSMSGCKITLSNEGTLDSDAVVFATGWKLNQSTFFPTPLLPDLGLPCKLSEQHPATQNHWSALDAASETQVRSLFPMLASPPAKIVEYDKAHTREVTTTPFRLFRNMVPPNLAVKDERDIIFLGTLINTAVPTYAEISSLWGIAYLEHLPFAPTATNLLSNLEEMEKEISLLNNFGWLRFRDKSANYLDGSIEIQSFMDLLVRDLGLETRRKKKKQRGCFGMKGWWREWFRPYMGEDYRGLVAEYLEKWKLGEQSKKA